MAGDWIKVVIGLADTPEVFAISERLQVDPDLVVGKLVRFWSWANAHTIDGHAVGVTLSRIDRYVSCDNFADALCNVGWLSIENDGIRVPKFERHNGASAKKRAQCAARQQVRRIRAAGDNPVYRHAPVTLPSRSESDKNVTREEKRREEGKETPHKPPKGAAYSPAFEAFWRQYPRKDGKGAAWKAWNSAGGETINGALLSGLERWKRSSQWTRDGGEFIPHLSTWLNRRQWEDEPKPASVMDQAAAEVDADAKQFLGHIFGKEAIDG